MPESRFGAISHALFKRVHLSSHCRRSKRLLALRVRAITGHGPVLTVDCGYGIRYGSVRVQPTGRR